MNEYGRTPDCSLPHRLADHLKKPLILLLLALMASVSAPLASGAQGAPNPLCASCHNADGNSTNPEYPKIAGLDAKYIIKQIKDFKRYKRVSEIMGPVAAKIDDDEIEALAAYFSTRKRTPGIVTDRALAAQGQLIYDQGIDSSAVPACAGCHESDGSGWKKIPRLAGQHTTYLINQLGNFKSGVRKNDGRMRAVAKRLTEQEIKAVAEYIASLKGYDQ